MQDQTLWLPNPEIRATLKTPISRLKRRSCCRIKVLPAAGFVKNGLLRCAILDRQQREEAGSLRMVGLAAIDPTLLYSKVFLIKLLANKIAILTEITQLRQAARLRSRPGRGNPERMSRHPGRRERKLPRPFPRPSAALPPPPVWK